MYIGRHEESFDCTDENEKRDITSEARDNLIRRAERAQKAEEKEERTLPWGIEL